jgi:uncharacterized protein YecA (UPF0149 family)
LADLYAEQGVTEQAAAWRRQVESEWAQFVRTLASPPLAVATPPMASVRATPKRGRNEPCWCGSGFKRKRCHLDVVRGRPR